MANIKPEDGDHPLWQGYSLQAPATSAAQQHPSFEPNYPSNPLNLPYHGRPQKSYRSMDIPSINTRPPPRDGGGGVLTASPPSLNTHHSYPSLKRPFTSTDDSPYGEVVQDFREELSEHPKPSISQDHRLLSFSKRQEKYTVIDHHGRIQQMELSAQIHGMFFLSEMTTPTGEGMIVQPELTCYRRNLFQISGSVTTPRGSLQLITDRGERLPILSLEVSISATESVDHHSVKLIVIPWKTPPPNSPESASPGVEQEPSNIPLLPFEDGSPDVNNDFAVYPIAYRRLQFRIATANNGRRRELQQHFTLHLNIIATLGNGSKVNVCETSTAPIVVRGRSPRNFQARKEIALVGSSASRGQAPELHITTSSAPSSTTTARPKSAKPQTLELPRSPFNFDASHLPASPLLMRQSSYPSSWSGPSHPAEHSTAPPTPNYPAAPLAVENYLQVSHSSADAPQNITQTHPPSAPMSAPPAPSSRQQQQQQQQFSYQHSTATTPSTNPTPLRFIDNNPRPSKSPRHNAAPELSTSNHSFPDFSSRFASPYAANNNDPPQPVQPRDYFPTSGAWTTAPETLPAFGTAMPAPNLPHYQFPNEQQYVKEEHGSGQPHYTWNPA